MNRPIVILRTVSVEKMSPVLAACRDRWPMSPIWVVSSPNRVQEMEHDARVATVVSYEGQGGFERPVMMDTERDFEAVVVPTSNEGGSGYGNVLGSVLGVEAVGYFICSRCRELRSLGRAGFALRARGERVLGFLARSVSGFWAERILARE